MPQRLEHYQELAKRMIEADRERDIAFEAYDLMYHNGWNLPPELKKLEWIRKVISSDPHDAVASGRRVLSTLPPRPRVLPFSDDQLNRDKANEIERILRWALKQANRRRRGTVEADVVQSALLYSEVVANVVDVDWQIEQAKSLNASPSRLKAMRRYGRFMFNVFNPRSTHVLYSAFMPEAVLICQNRPAVEVVAEWGDRAKALRAAAESGRQVKVYDYCDYDVRALWLEEEGGNGESVILSPEEHGLGFLPFTAQVGGSTLEEKGVHQRQPILYPIYTSGAWDTQNLIQTFLTSDSLARAAAPRYAAEGANPEGVKVDYNDPSRIAEVPAGNSLKELRPPEIDQALMQLEQLHSAKIDKSTISRVLQGGEVPAGLAFSALNMLTQTALGALRPAKDLAEKSLAELLTLMLHWVQYTGKPFEARGFSEDDAGAEYTLEPDEIDPTEWIVEVELTPDVPTDRLQRINAAALAVQIGYSQESALEDIGVEDPKRELKKRTKEQVQAFLLQQKFQELQMQQQMAAQQAQMAQQMEAQAMAQQQAMQGQPGLGGPVMGGQGMDPAMGGIPPAMSNPGATREMASGMDRMGQGVME
jgi:hypothetical protein